MCECNDSTVEGKSVSDKEESKLFSGAEIKQMQSAFFTHGVLCGLLMAVIIFVARWWVSS